MKDERSREPELRLLLEDFGARRSAGGAPRRAAPDEGPPPRLLLEDYRPGAGVNGLPPLRPVPAPDIPTPQFLVPWERRAAHRREGLLASLGVHLVWVILLLLQPYIDVREPSPPEPEEFTDVAIVAPPRGLLEELAEANRERRPMEPFRGEPTPPVPAPRAVEPAPRLPTPEPEPEPELPQPVEPEEAAEPPKPVAEEPPPEPEEEAPPAAQAPQPDEFQRGRELAEARDPRELPAPRAPEKPPEKPRLRLEDPKATMPGREGRLQLGELGLNTRPDQVIESAVQQMVERGGGKQAVGEGVGAGATGGYLEPAPGEVGSGVELLSDPKGVDFRPYLLQILNAVRRNWYAVIPESARLGMERGRVTIQFAVARTGDVPKLVIADTSGSHPLDRAAVAGISASLPFPPLPAEFSGEQVRLQFVFLYNIRR